MLNNKRILVEKDQQGTVNKRDTPSIQDHHHTLLYRLAFYPQYSKLRIGQFIVAILIFGLFALTPSPQDLGVSGPDSLLHFIGNILLILSTWVACLGKFRAFVPLLFAIPYSVMIEFSQSFTENRTTELSDILANLIGILVGFGLCYAMSFLLKKYA